MKSFLKLFLIGFFLSFSSYGQNIVHVTSSSTSNCADGTITINVSGGTSPYQY
ncbi:MAG: SprB repeat-containing protein [Cytophagaceae bacterium]|nr:SprB repeat-containing protein [Cytophagaceae bacterium]